METKVPPKLKSMKGKRISKFLNLDPLDHSLSDKEWLDYEREEVDLKNGHAVLLWPDFHM